MKAQFALNLAEFMVERNMSQSELSRLSGIAQSSISDYLNGKCEPKQDKVDAIASALMVSPSMLIGSQPHPLETSEDLTPYQIATLKLMGDMSLQGQSRVANYAEDLHSSGNYNRQPKVITLKEESEDKPEILMAAYSGEELDDEKQAEALQAREEFWKKQEKGK